MILRESKTECNCEKILAKCISDQVGIPMIYNSVNEMALHEAAHYTQKFCFLLSLD